jgi:biotin transport system substrate-specific component
VSTVTTLAMRAAPRGRTVAHAAYLTGLTLVGVSAIALLAQVRIQIGMVPITGQTLGVLLVGAAYGPVLGTATLVAYLAAGVLGAPVFAPNADGGHATGWDALGLAAPTAGYLVGFVAAAGVVGVLARRGWDRTFGSAVGAMLIGSVVLYAVGLPWLRQALEGLGAPSSWQDVLAAGLYPFVIGDLIKIFVAAGALPLAWRAMERARPED